MQLHDGNQEDRPPFRENSQFFRPLYINFERYTDGDPEYKTELVSLIINNIKEFQQSIMTSIYQNDPGLFNRAFHKAKVLLDMLDDKELIEIVHDLEKNILNPLHEKNIATLSKHCQNICNSIIASLKLHL